MGTLVNFPQTTHQEVVHLMSNLAEMVIKEPPCDIYVFAQKYFEQLLVQRDGGADREYERMRQCAAFIKKSPQGEMNLGKINKKRRIDIIGLYRKQSEEKKMQPGSQDDDDRLIGSTKEECLAEEEIPKETPNKQEEEIAAKKPQTPHRVPLKLYRSLHQNSFDAISEVDEHQEVIQEAPTLDEDFLDSNQLQIIPKTSTQDVAIVNHVIQIYLPHSLATHFEEILLEKDVEEVELMPYRSPHSVKFSILAWNDYGMVISVECGLNSEVIVFLLKMPDDEEDSDLTGDNPLLKAIEYGPESPKFEVDSEIFRGFLMKFLDSFYPHGEYQQLIFPKAEGPENFSGNQSEILALEYKDAPEMQASNLQYEDSSEIFPEVESFREEFTDLEKTLGFLRMGDDRECRETHQLFRPRSAPATKVPKHLRQRVKSAK